MKKEAAQSFPERQEILTGDYEDQARIFDVVEYDFEDDFWVDESLFDIWSYKLINVPENYFFNKTPIKNKKK